MSIFGKRKLNILVLGADGMLGYDVYEHFKKQATLKYPSIGNPSIGTVTGTTLADGIDVTRRHALCNWMQDKIHYDWCINCIAYTDTQKAEHDAQGKLDSYKLNALAPKYIAESCNFFKTKLIHISSDYVFSERSRTLLSLDLLSRTLLSSVSLLDAVASIEFPKNNYGLHKLLGEKGVAESFKNKKNYAVLRTSWLYGAHNGKSFVHKFMKNVAKACKNAKANEEVVVDVTSDEHSVPTSTDCVITCIDDVIKHKRHGILHAVPVIKLTGNPPSRLDFAKEILAYYKYGEELFGCKLCDIVINGTNLPDDALQPSKSSMLTSFSEIGPWEWHLRNFMAKYSNEILKSATKENENE